MSDESLSRVRSRYRRWALLNVRRAAKRAKEPACGHWKHDPQPQTCVSCAYELGRGVGQVEAGAYYTMGEVFGRKP